MPKARRPAPDSTWPGKEEGELVFWPPYVHNGTQKLCTHSLREGRRERLCTLLCLLKNKTLILADEAFPLLGTHLVFFLCFVVLLFETGSSA